MDNKSTKNIVIFIVAAILIGFVAYLRSQNINHYIVGSTQSAFSGFDRLYLRVFYHFDKNTRINGQTPIQYAILSEGKLTEKKKQNLIPTIDFFLSKGVDINETSGYGLTALHYAVLNEDPIAVSLLIEKKADVNTPIHFEDAELSETKNPTEGMSPLKYLEDRKKQNKVKDKAKIDQIAAALKAAGALE